MEQSHPSILTTHNTTLSSSRQLLAFIACSFLVHTTVFAFSDSWTFSTENTDQPLLVELIDLPLQDAEKKPDVLNETTAKKFAANQEELRRGRTDASCYPGKHGAPLQMTAVNNKRGISTHHPAEATVSLDSTDSRYVSYLTKIKQKIEPLWHYPEQARAIGLQGKLALYFSIVEDGHLARLELISSSGHRLLDEQALQAVRRAAPYLPLPEKLQISRLNIHATFEYRISPYNMSTFGQSQQKKSL